MNADGVLYLSKTKPIASKTSSGEFQLSLFAVDRISHQPPIAEPYALVWTGPGAQTFWEKHRDALVPGQPLRVWISRMRSHTAPRSGAEIHARVDAMGLAPRANHQQAEAEKA